VNFLNQKSLRQSVELLVANNPLLKTIISDPEQFIQEVKSFRDGLTHDLGEVPEELFAKLIPITFKLRAVFAIVDLANLGIADEIHPGADIVWKAQHS